MCYRHTTSAELDFCIVFLYCSKVQIDPQTPESPQGHLARPVPARNRGEPAFLPRPTGTGRGQNQRKIVRVLTISPPVRDPRFTPPNLYRACTESAESKNRSSFLNRASPFSVK